MSIFNTYKTSKELFKDFNQMYNEVVHDGKKYLGETLVQDNRGRLWEIKVRWAGDQGRYLKIQSKSNSSQKIRATADAYKEYLRITPNEWEVFRRLAANQNNQEFYDECKRVLDRLPG